MSPDKDDHDAAVTALGTLGRATRQAEHQTEQLDYDAALNWARKTQGHATLAIAHLTRCRDEQEKRPRHDHL